MHLQNKKHRFFAPQSELARRREYELQKLRKELEMLALQHEGSEAASRKRSVPHFLCDHQDQLALNL